MQQSQSISKLAGALCSFQADMENVGKDAVNPFYKSKYASLENIISAVKPHLKTHQLAFAQFPDATGLTTILMHSSGEFISASVEITPKDNTPQGQGSAITYMRRYALSAVLGIATEDDDDGNAASTPRQASKTAPTATKAPKPVKDPSTELKAAKDRVVSLLKLLGKQCKTKKDYEDAVFDLTGMMLSDENLDEINEKLSALEEAKSQK